MILRLFQVALSGSIKEKGISTEIWLIGTPWTSELVEKNRARDLAALANPYRAGNSEVG